MTDKAFWSSKDPRNDPSASPFAELDFRVEILDKLDVKLGFKVFDKCYLKYFEDGELVRRAEFDKFCLEGWGPKRGQLFGVELSLGQASNLCILGWRGWMRPGRSCRSVSLTTGYIAVVLDNGNGTWAVISRERLPVPLPKPIRHGRK